MRWEKNEAKPEVLLIDFGFGFGIYSDITFEIMDRRGRSGYALLNIIWEFEYRGHNVDSSKAKVTQLLWKFHASSDTWKKIKIYFRSDKRRIAEIANFPIS